MTPAHRPTTDRVSSVSKNSPATKSPATKSARRLWVTGPLLLSVAAGGLTLGLGGAPDSDAKTADTTLRVERSGQSQAERLDSLTAPKQLCVAHPAAGGLARRIVQTGSVEAAEAADVFAKVSGYLQAIHVDIGAEVEAGEPLAELDVPELAQELQRRKSLLEQARGEARECDARLNVMQGEQETAEAVVSEAESKIQQHVLERRLYEKETKRLDQLVRQGAIEEKLLDEKRHLLEIARSAEQRARQAVRVAKARWEEVGPRVELAEAECSTAHAAVAVAASEVEHAEIMLRYCNITSPFSGVVTQRNVDPGNFVQSAAEGGSQPMFKVSRTDQMKVVVSVPDRFVPYINPEDRAEVRIDALHGEVFEGKVARVARFQDRKTRTMRVEVDLPNDDGRLIDGMYGSVTLHSPPPAESVTVPAASVAVGTENSRGDLYVVRDGRLTKVPVWIGQNDGHRAEVLSGLTPNELVACQISDARSIGEGELAEVQIKRTDTKDFLAGASESLGVAHP